MYDVLLEACRWSRSPFGLRSRGSVALPATINLVGAEVELVSALAREFAEEGPEQATSGWATALRLSSLTF